MTLQARCGGVGFVVFRGLGVGSWSKGFGVRVSYGDLASGCRIYRVQGAGSAVLRKFRFRV